MARCADCRKFVSFDEGNVDEVELDIDEDTGEAELSGRVVLPCAECGTDLVELDTSESGIPLIDSFDSTVLEAIHKALPEYADKITDEVIEASNGSTDPLAMKVRVKYELDDEPDKSFHEEKKKGKLYKGVTVSGTVKRTIHVSIPGRPGTEIVDDADYEHTYSDIVSSFTEC